MKATIFLTFAALIVVTAAHHQKAVESEKLPAHPFFKTVLKGLKGDAVKNLHTLWHGLSKEQKHEAVETLKKFNKGEYQFVAQELRALTHEQLKNLKEELKKTNVRELLENAVADHFIQDRAATEQPSGAEGLAKDKTFYGVVFAVIGVIMSVLRH